jgi:hypothetical protein
MFWSSLVVIVSGGIFAWGLIANFTRLERRIEELEKTFDKTQK